MSKITRVVESLDTEDTGVCDTNLKPKGNDPKGNSSKGEISTKMLFKKKKMAKSKALNRNRLRTMFVNLWKLFYHFPNVYYLNGNSEDLLVESLIISTNTFSFAGL